MDGSTLIETLFSIKATIGVVIFALVPLLEGITLRTTSEKRAMDIKFELYEEMKTLAAFFVAGTLVDSIYLGAGYSLAVDPGFNSFLQNYPVLVTTASVVFDLLPLLSLGLTLGIVILVVASGFQIIETLEKKHAAESPK